MKALTLPLIVLGSWTLNAAISPRTCDQLLQTSSALVEGLVKNIHVEHLCLSDACNYFTLKYTAELVVADVIKGENIQNGQTLQVNYEENFDYPRDGEYAPPGFQGHGPLPNEEEYWPVFLDATGDGFTVAPPNGWWGSNEEKCW